MRNLIEAGCGTIREFFIREFLENMILMAEYFHNKEKPDGFLVSQVGENYMLCFKEKPSPQDLVITRTAETRWLDLSPQEERTVYKLAKELDVKRDGNVSRIYISRENEKDVASIIIALRIRNV